MFLSPFLKKPVRDRGFTPFLKQIECRLGKLLRANGFWGLWMFLGLSPAGTSYGTVTSIVRDVFWMWQRKWRPLSEPPREY